MHPIPRSFTAGASAIEKGGFPASLIPYPLSKASAPPLRLLWQGMNVHDTFRNTQNAVLRLAGFDALLRNAEGAAVLAALQIPSLRRGICSPGLPETLLRKAKTVVGINRTLYLPPAEGATKEWAETVITKKDFIS